LADCLFDLALWDFAARKRDVAEIVEIAKIVASQRAKWARRSRGSSPSALAAHVLAAFGNEPQPGIVRQVLLGLETRRARWITGSEPGREADCDDAEPDEEQIPLHSNLIVDRQQPMARHETFLSWVVQSVAV
jgi:hypothetical protein